MLLRAGRLTLAEIEAVAGEPVQWSRPEAPDPSAPKASGTLMAHYAPRAKVRLMDARPLQAALDVLGDDARHIAVYARTPIKAARGVSVRRMPADASHSARELFAVLRELDATGVRLIWVETPPTDATWDGVRDRLVRAAA